MIKTYEFESVNMNALHDHLLAALRLSDVTALRVEGVDGQVRLTFPDWMETQVDAAVRAYTAGEAAGDTPTVIGDLQHRGERLAFFGKLPQECPVLTEITTQAVADALFRVGLAEDGTL